MPDGRLLLEGVQHVDSALEPHGVHRPIGVPVVRLDHFQDARAEALLRLRRRGRSAELRDAESVAHVFCTAFGKSRRYRVEDPTQCSGFSPEAGTRRTVTIFHFWDARARATGE